MKGGKLYLATGNAGKAAEFAAILRPMDVVAVSLELDELQSRHLEVISAHKAEQAARTLGAAALVDDSGLFVRTLGGFPGPYTAYVLETIGLQGVIDLLASHRDRSAAFVSVVSYAEPGAKARVFRGEVGGTITTVPRGENGFGFDPIFEYQGRTFAELSSKEKNGVSHRFRALQAFREWYMAERAE